MRLRQIQAFTLAEVLVTLMIIGVIAAMTIPTLQQNTRNNEMVAGCLKAYSTLSQAIDRMKPDYGPVGYGTKWNDAAIFWMGEKKDYREGFVSNLNVVKACLPNEKGCNWSGVPKQLGGRNHTNSYDGYQYNVRTTDGMSINYSAGDCGVDKGVSAERLGKGSLGRFLVDVNGDRGPNRFGYDLFFFCVIRGDGVVPAGTDNNSANCVKGGTGIDCAAKVIKEKKIDIKNSN